MEPSTRRCMIPLDDWEKWDKFRHIFGYGDVPSNFGQ
jgi:hypothetical protein